MINENEITPQPDATDRQEFLLTVAEELFAEHGFDGTSIRMIADKSGMNVAMISYYFGSKEKMFEELIARRVAHMRTLADQLKNTEHLDPWQKMELLVDGYVDRIMKNQSMFHKCMMRELSLRKRPGIVQAIEERLMSNMKVFHGIVRDGIDAGIFRPDVDFAMIMMMLVGTVTHAMSSTNLTKKFTMLDSMLSESLPADIAAIRQRAKDVMKKVFARYMLIDPSRYNYN